MLRKSWCLVLGTLLIMRTAAQADDGPCKSPPRCPVARTQTQPDDKLVFEQFIEDMLMCRVSLDVHDMPLTKMVDYLRQYHGLNVALDQAALQAAGIDPQICLSLQVERITLRSALNVLLKSAKLAYQIKDGVLEITTQEAARGKLRTVTYPVADLVVPLGTGENALPPFLCHAFSEIAGERQSGTTAEDVLIRLIIKTIESASWTDNGGRGTIQYFPVGLALVVCQTAEVQQQIATLLSELRHARNLEYREEQVEARLVRKTPTGEEVEHLPKLTIFRGQKACISICDSVAIRDGTIRDLLHSASASEEAQEEGTSPKSPDVVKTGIMLWVRITKAEHGMLKLDVSVEKSELAEATPTSLRVTGQTSRLIQRVDSGSTVKLVLAQNERGEPRSWVLLTLTELPVAQAESEEQIFLGNMPNMPPIPR